MTYADLLRSLKAEHYGDGRFDTHDSYRIVVLTADGAYGYGCEVSKRWARQAAPFSETHTAMEQAKKMALLAFIQEHGREAIERTVGRRNGIITV